MTATRTLKVLLVEDDITMKDVLRTLLEIEGFQVSIAPDRVDSSGLMAYIKNERPDTILMDVHLRNMSGIALLREVRIDQNLAPTRVIMTSGSDMKDQCITAGADSFILKPFMPDELISKIRG